MKKTLLFLLLLCGFIAQAQPIPKYYIIKAGKLFDSEKAVFLKNQFIVVRGNKVIEVTTKADKYPEDSSRLIDLSKATLIPGLIDAHTHFLFMQKSGVPMEDDLIEHSDLDRVLRGAGIARSFLEAGITTTRDLGNSGPYLDLALKKALEKQWVSGARMFVSGPIISPPGGQFGPLSYLLKDLPAREYSIVRTTDEAVSAVQEHIAQGVDVIKICATNDNGATLSVEQMKAMVEAAHAKGIKVTAHATYDQVIYDAVLAGVDGIEHGYGISDSTLQLMARQEVYLVPTDGTFDGYKGIVEYSKSSPITDQQIKEFVAASEDRLQRAVKFGVKIVFGSDLYLYTPRPIGLEAKNTLVYYHQAGLKVGHVLQTATKNAAQVLGKENELGVIKPNALADIVAFDGDLENDFEKLIYEKVSFVMQDGKIVKENR